MAVLLVFAHARPCFLTVVVRSSLGGKLSPRGGSVVGCEQRWSPFSIRSLIRARLGHVPCCSSSRFSVEPATRWQHLLSPAWAGLMVACGIQPRRGAFQTRCGIRHACFAAPGRLFDRTARAGACWLHLGARTCQPQRLCQPQRHPCMTFAACGSQQDLSSGGAGACFVRLQKSRPGPGPAGSPLQPRRRTAVAARRTQRDLDDWTTDADGPGVQARRPVGRGEPREGSGWQQQLWGAVDVGATLGAVGGAVAFVLTQEALLVGLPVVLPLLALYASRRHAQLRLEVRGAARLVLHSRHGCRRSAGCWQGSSLRTTTCHTCLQAALAEVAAGMRATGEGVAEAVAGEAAAAADAVAALRGELARQLPPGQLRAIEAKLAALEGSVLSAGAGVQPP